MIKDYELRKGNWAKMPDAQFDKDDMDSPYFQVHTLGEDVAHWVKECPNTMGFIHSGSFYEDIEGITITGDILLKAGFTYHDGTYWISLSSTKAELHIEVYKKEVVPVIYGTGTEFILDSIKYVHQLQNLYFVLAGEGLNIKL